MEERGAPPSERVSFEELPGTHSISGLGKGSEETNVAACIPCHARGLGGGQTFFKGAYLDNQPSPAIMGLCSLKALDCIIDCRGGRETMYVSPQGQDYAIQVTGERGRALPLVRTRSGHIMLPISGFQGQENYQNKASEEPPTEWELLSAQSLR